MKVLALACACVALVALSAPVGAQSTSGFTVGEIATNSCWIDAATGQRVDTGPYRWSPVANPSNPDPNHVSSGGKTYVRVQQTGWIDTSTGNSVPTGPYRWSPVVNPSNPDPNHVSSGGKTYVRIPCPPPGSQAQQAQPMQPPPQGDQTMNGPPPGYDQGSNGPPPGYDTGGPPPTGPPIGVGGFGFGFGFGHKF